jgi:hypothetical protein
MAKLANAQSAFLAAHLGPIREELAIADDKVEQAAAVASLLLPRSPNYEYQRRKTARLRCSSPSPAKPLSRASP